MSNSKILEFKDNWLDKVSKAVEDAKYNGKKINPQVWVNSDIWDTFSKYRLLVKYGIIEEIK